MRNKLQGNPNIYRTKLGVSLALTEMLRRDKLLRDKMNFDQADLGMLLDFAGSDDRNLRIYSGEFLYDLESPDVTKQALPRALHAPSDDARYTWILVSQGGWIKLSEEEKAQLRPIIEQLRESTREMPQTAELLNVF